MPRFLIRWLVTGLAIVLASYLLPHTADNNNLLAAEHVYQEGGAGVGDSNPGSVSLKQ